MARRPPAPPAAIRPAHPTGTQSRGGMSLGLSGQGRLEQSLVMTPRIRGEVDDTAVEAATMLPTHD